MIGSASSFTCPGCCEPIREGQPIGKVDSEYVCQECVDAYGGETSSDLHSPDQGVRRA